MTAVMVQSLFPVFHDAQGKPLDGGYVYIGMIGVNPETNPVPVYWDAAKTIPAAQPIRTIAGFPSRNGSPAAIFTDGDVSVTLRDAGRALVWSALDGQTAQAGFMGQEPVYFFSGAGTSAPIVLPVRVSGPEYLRVFVNGVWLRPGIDFTASGYDLAPAGDYDAWPVGVNNISVSLFRQVALANMTSGMVSHDGGTVEDALDTLLPENVIRLSDYLHPDDRAAAIAGNTTAQNGARVTASAQAWLEACLAATLAQDGANIIGLADAGIYRVNNRLMTDAFHNLNWSTAGFARSRLRLRTDGSVRFRLQGWAGGRAAMRTDGPYAGSSYIAPVAVFEWFQATGHQRFGGMEGQWIIEGEDNPVTDPMGFYLYRLNASTFNGELEVTNLRNRTFVWDSIFNSRAEYVRSSGSAGVMLTEAGGSGLLPADTTSTVAGVTRRTGLRYTLSGANITINTMVRNETADTIESSTPTSVFTADHVGKWIGLDRQGREQLVGDDADETAAGGSTRRAVRWYQIASVTDGFNATLAIAPPQQGTTGQMVQQNRTFSFEVLKCSVTAGSATVTLSMPVTTSLVGLEVTIPGAHYDGTPIPARRPHLCAMVVAHTGNTVTLSHAAGVTRSGVPFVIAPQVTIGSLSHTEFLASSRNCDDFHIERLWCESGQTAALPLFVQDATNVTIGQESKLHGCPSTNNVNFGANFAGALLGDFGLPNWMGRVTHSRHSREFGMFYLGGDRSEMSFNGELSSWTADDQSAIFYIDPANVATTRIWDVYVNASDVATGFPDPAAGQVFERGGPNYTPGRVKGGASQRSPRGERPLWPPVAVPPSRAPWWGSTRADAVSALARGGVVPENGVTYTIGGLRYRGVTSATAISDLPGLVPFAPYHVDQMGVTGDGTADDYARIQALITYVGQNGGGLITFGAAQYGLSAQLVVEHSGVFLEGQGAAAFRPPPSEAGILASARTSFVPLVGFPSGDSAVLFRTPAGAQRCIGGGMRGIHIAGYARCAAGLRIVTWEHGEFDRLSIYGATVANLDLDVTTTATLATGAIYDTQWNRFSNIYCNNVNKPASDSANALRTNAFENVGGVNPDPVPASIGNPNVSYNSFDNCQFISNSVAAANMIGATDNLFTNCQALVNNDLDQITTQGWSLTSADQDTRLNATVTKRNRFEKCHGRFHARASQAGRASSYLNVIDGHMTHTRAIFRVPVVFEAPAGGALPADLLISNDFGDLYQRRLIGEYTDIEKRRSFLDVAVLTINVSTTGGGTAITVSGAIPDGAVVLGVTTRVTTAISGAAGYQVGTVADPDRFGQVTGFAVGTRTGNADWTVGTIELFTAATDIVITRTTGVFNAGVIALCVYYARATSEHS
jgi:hypothetical protein